MSTALSKQQQSGFVAVRDMFQRDDFKMSLAEALPRHLTPERMARVALTSLRKTPQLLKCTPASIAKAVLEAASLGLEVDGVLGMAYLVPFGDECQLLPGYRGLIHLARQSGEIALIKAGVVYRGDEFVCVEVPPQLLHTQTGDPTGEVTHAYGWARLLNGSEDFCAWPTDRINAHRKRYSKGDTRKDSAWNTAWEWMAKKTVLRQLCKLLPMSVEAQRLVQREDYYEAGVLGVQQNRQRAYVSTLNETLTDQRDDPPQEIVEEATDLWPDGETETGDVPISDRQDD